MRLQYKLLLINAAAATVAALVLWLAYQGTRTVGAEYLALGGRTLPSALAAAQIKAATLSIEATINRLAMLQLAEDPQSVAREQAVEMAELRQSMVQLRQGVAIYSSLADSPYFANAARRLDIGADVILNVSGEVLVQLNSGIRGKSLLEASGRLVSGVSVLLGRVEEVLDREQQELTGREAEVVSAIAWSGRLTAGAGAVTLLVMIATCVIVARTITSPIARLTAATALVGQGEFRPIDAPTSRDEIGRLVGAFRRMTEDLASSQARARHLAVHDPLTGLPNRTLLFEQLSHALARMRRHGTALAVLCLDLDRFKEVNDTLGHTAGDQLLRQVAERLVASARETDTVVRLGGDEFVIVQDAADQPTDAAALCRRLLDALRVPFQLDGQEATIGVSIGVALAPSDGQTPEALLKNADIALYRVKEEGREAFRFFEEDMNRELQTRRALERDLRQAVSEEQFELRYQPQVELRSGRIVGAEALIRWRHPERGEVMPDLFIALAEETGLIVPIGEWALREACRQAVAWPPLRIAVNLSPVQFRQGDLGATVERVLHETGLDPGRLELEITEGLLLEHTEAALATLQTLRQLGVSIAMDDFGTGYSSLGYLRRFPFNKIKIDRSFVADLQHSADAAAIVRSVVSLGGSLGITTNAEGVEAAIQADLLRAEGCDEVQGYHFGRPMPPAEFTRLLAAARTEPEPEPLLQLASCPA